MGTFLPEVYDFRQYNDANLAFENLIAAPKGVRERDDAFHDDIYAAARDSKLDDPMLASCLM
jgi:uracil phosphoribosyltransferase